MMRTRRAAAADEGFTLIEVVVAVVLLALVFTSVGAFFVKGISTATGLQRRSSAVQVADQALQLVRGVPAARSATGLSPLLRGRSEAAVLAQWSDAPAGLTRTRPAWDPNPAGVAPLLPLTATASVGSQTYTVETFIGTCRQPVPPAACTNTVVDGVVTYRVVVRVRWSEGVGTRCGARACEYLVTTMVDGSGDPVFNSGADAARPVARADDATTAHATDVTVNLLANDTYTGLAPSPVSMSGNPPLHGTFVGSTSGGSVRYRPDPGFAGVDSFSYRLTDSSDLTSDPGTVTIVINPPSTVADSASTTAPSPVSVDVMANDQGTLRSGTVTATQVSSAQGTATISSNRVVYTPRAGFSGTATVGYTVTGGGHTATGTLTVTVTRPPAPTSTAVTRCYRSGTTGQVSVVVDLGQNVTGTKPGGTYAAGTMSGWSGSLDPSTGVLTLTSTAAPTSGSLTWSFTDAWGQAAPARSLTLSGTSTC